MHQPRLVGGPVVGVSELLGHVGDVIVVVDDVSPPIFWPSVLPSVAVICLLLVWILLYLRHGVNPLVVERFEVSPTGQVVGRKMQISWCRLAHPGGESVVRVVRLGVWLGGVARLLSRHVSWQSVEG